MAIVKIIDENRTVADRQSIAEYLQMNPDIFERHEGLLTKLKLSHNRGAATESLIERQVVALRD